MNGFRAGVIETSKNAAINRQIIAITRSSEASNNIVENFFEV